MSKKIFTMMIVMMMSLPGLLACGASEGSQESASSQVSVGQEAEAETAAETASEAAAEAETEADDTSVGEGQDTAVQPESETDESPEAAQETVEETEPAGAAQPFEGTVGLEESDSFQADIVLEFEGARGQSTGEALTSQRQTYLLEVTRDPQARHQITTIKSEGGIDVEAENEMYLVDGVTYTKAFGSWTAQPGLMGLSQFANPKQFVFLPDTATCASDLETVNGIAARRCTFTGADSVSDAFEAGSLNGTVWVAEADDTIVKYELEARDLRLRGRFEGLSEMDLYKISYELAAVDGDVSISLPAEAAGTQPVDIASMGSDEASGFAAPEGAEIIFDEPSSLIYFTQSDPAALAEFHRQSLGDAGWQELADDSYVEDNTALLAFENESGVLRVFVSEDIDGGFFVTLTPPFEVPDFGGAEGAAPGTGSSDYPLLEDAENVVSAGGATTYYTTSDIPAILEFYRQQLPESGWTEDEASGFSDDTSALLQFSRDGQVLMVTARAEAEGRVNVAVINTTP